MMTREQWRAFETQGWVQTIEFALGVLLLIVALLVGPIPGPGGLFFAVPGLVLVLRTSLWAKKNYVRFKRWQPKAGRWTDWALRRKSAQRREELRKLREAAGEEAVADARSGALDNLLPGPPKRPLGELFGRRKNN